MKVLYKGRTYEVEVWEEGLFSELPPDILFSSKVSVIGKPEELAVYLKMKEVRRNEKAKVVRGREQTD